MTNITISATGIDEDIVNNIVEQIKQASTTTEVIIKKPWPKMQTGDRFLYNDTEYVFLTYVDVTKGKCVPASQFFESSVMQAEYFNTKSSNDSFKLLGTKDESCIS